MLFGEVIAFDFENLYENHKYTMRVNQGAAEC